MPAINSIKTLTKELARREIKRSGKGKEVDMGNIREIVSHLSDMAFEHDRDGQPFHYFLVDNGKRRARRKKAK